MNSLCLKLFLVVIVSQRVHCDTINSPSASIEDSFKQCLISQPSLIGHCLGVGALTKLQTLDSHPEFDLIDGVTLARENQEFRDNYNFADTDPTDFRSIMDTMGHIFAQRALKWDMDFIYPGLALRVAPSIVPGGTLEFILDPHREILQKQSLKEAGTGTILARQFLVPLLLGFKFNIATILPLIFAVLTLLAKKAVFVSKIALVISSAYGLGTLLLGNGNKVQQSYYSPGQYQGHHGFNPSFGQNFKIPDEYTEVLYRGMNEHPVQPDQLNLYANLQEVRRREESPEGNGRNFAWSEDEKLTKKKV